MADNESTDQAGMGSGEEFLYGEIHALLRRVAHECDISSCAALGVLDLVKADIRADLRADALG